VRNRLDGWKSRHATSSDGTVESVQRARTAGPVVEVSEAGALELGSHYWREAVRAARGLVRCGRAEDGVELRLLGRGPVLLGFRRAVTSVEADQVSCSYPIRGGWLVRREGGMLMLSQSGGKQVELRAAVTGFHPRLGLPLGHVQRRVHAAISRRYFAGLIAEAGS
jgi:hypothetical protein